MAGVPGESSGKPAKPAEVNQLLQELLDQPELFRRLLTVFIGETGKDIAELTAALDRRDPARVAAVAHRLKGSAATMGAEPMRAEAERIEAFGRQGQLHPARERLPALNEHFEAFCTYVAGLAGRG